MDLLDDSGKKLPEKIQHQMNQYIERIKNINWFQPASKLSKKTIEKQVSATLKAFGCEAKIEYRELETVEDWQAALDAARGAARDAAWGAARDAAWDAAWGAARDAAWDAARDAAWDAAWDAARGAARDAAWGAARDAAWGAAWGAQDLLALNLKEYKKSYPNGNFINLIPLWEFGLYPVGIVEGKFLIYIPPYKLKFPRLD